MRIFLGRFDKCLQHFLKKLNHIAVTNKWKYKGHRGKQMLHIHILSSYVERKTDTEDAKPFINQNSKYN